MNEIDINISAVFMRMYDSIAYVPANEFSGRHSRVNEKPTLRSTYIPLPSNLTMTLSVVNLRLDEVCVRRDGEYRLCLGHDGKLRGTSPPARRRNQLRQEGFPGLLSAADAVLDARNVDATPKGLSLAPRPLVLAPLWTDGVKEDVVRLDALTALGLFRRSVLLGPPGSGKSTIAKGLVCLLLERQFHFGEAHPELNVATFDECRYLPIYIEVRRLVAWSGFPSVEKESVTFDACLEYIKIELCNGDSAVLAGILSGLSTHGLFVFDGLDEIIVSHDEADELEKRQRQLRDLMRSLNTRFPHATVVVTSRPAGYSQWILDGFEEIELFPLDDRDASRLVNARYIGLGLSNEKALDRASLVADHLKKVPAALRSQPLFIVLLALLHLRDDSSPLPSSRGALIGHSIELLLNSWTVQRLGLKSLTQLLGCEGDEIVSCLERVSYSCLNQSPREEGLCPDIRRKDLLDEFYELGRAVRLSELFSYLTQTTGLLASIGGREYRFSHRMFQEYLAAAHIARNSLPLDEIFVLVERSPAIWSEVVLLLADVHCASGAALNTRDLVVRLLDKGSSLATWLAGRIVTDHPEVDFRRSPSMDYVRVRLNSRGEVAFDERPGLGARKRAEIGLALGVVGDLRSGVGISGELPSFAWVDVPVGETVIGTDPDDVTPLRDAGIGGGWNFNRESPRHRLEVDAFRIARYPVTVAQFALFVDSHDGYKSDDCWTLAGREWRDANRALLPVRGKPGNFPQTDVTWYEAKAFCSWASRVLGMSIRLPTEVEWERAGRGSDGRLFPWGSDVRSCLANTREAEVGEVVVVGCFGAVESWLGNQGPVDLVGNIWEWCSTLVEMRDGREFRYPYVSDDGREDVEIGDDGLRATRGGYYGCDLAVARCAYRGRDLPSRRLARQGFRVVSTG